MRIQASYSRRIFTKLSGAGLLVSALGVSVTAQAHREAASTTNIIWSDTDKSLHITHVMHTHDAQRALFHAGLLDKPDLTPLKSQAILALYMSENFSVSTSEKSLPLGIIGAEIIGRSVYVYHEAPIAARPETLIITANMFQPLVNDFINHIDITTQNGTQSYRQTKTSEPISLDF